MGGGPVPRSGVFLLQVLNVSMMPRLSIVLLHMCVRVNTSMTFAAVPWMLTYRYAMDAVIALQIFWSFYAGSYVAMLALAIETC